MSAELVLGVHTRLSAGSIEPFVRSLRASGFGGRFVIFAGLCDDEEKERLRGFADLVIDVDAEYPRPPAAVCLLLRFLRSTRGFRRAYPVVFTVFARLGTKSGSLRRWGRLEYHLEGLQSLRYLHYKRYLGSVNHAPDAILLTDLRDVVFQRHPFGEKPAELELYLETEAVPIGDDTFNSRWIRDLYGEAELERWRNRIPSCSGTVVGTNAGVLAYLDEMSREIVRYRRPMGSHDQGVHNVLLRRGRFRRASLVANGTGRVLTLGKMERWVEAADGTLLNENGSVPAVIHQWDRHAALVPRIEGVRDA